MKYFFILVLVAAVVFAGVQILEPVFANLFFEDELHDVAVQPGSHIGFSAPKSDEEVRNSVIRRGWSHDITLDPKQVSVKRLGEGEKETLFISVDYFVTVNLIVYSFNLHFSPTSKGVSL
jgi:hypothetical protein